MKIAEWWWEEAKWKVIEKRERMQKKYEITRPRYWKVASKLALLTAEQQKDSTPFLEEWRECIFSNLDTTEVDESCRVTLDILLNMRSFKRDESQQVVTVTNEKGSFLKDKGWVERWKLRDQFGVFKKSYASQKAELQDDLVSEEKRDKGEVWLWRLFEKYYVEELEKRKQEAEASRVAAE